MAQTRSHVCSRPHAQVQQVFYCFSGECFLKNSNPNYTDHERKGKNKFNFFSENWVSHHRRLQARQQGNDAHHKELSPNLQAKEGKDYKPRSKKVCYKCGKPGHFIAKCPMSSDSDRGDDKKGRRKEKKKYYKKKGDDAHVCREWDSDESTTDSSSDEDAANIAVNKGLLFPNVGHKFLMAKDDKKKKVQARTTPKYTTSSDEGSSSDDEDDLLSLFANLNM
jgi:hypothetical protein